MCQFFIWAKKNRKISSIIMFLFVNLFSIDVLGRPAAGRRQWMLLS
jgi:hypothetical protein